MPTRKRRRPTTIGILTIALLCVGAIGGLASYARNAPGIPKAEHRELKPDPGVVVQNRQEGPALEVHTRPSSENEKADVLVPRYEGHDLKFDSKSVSVPKGEDARVFAVEGFLKNANVLPPGARLLGVSVNDGVATISFNREIFNGFGSDDERTLVNGLAHVLGQFKDIDKFVLLGNGEAVDSLGHLDLSEPQPVVR